MCGILFLGCGYHIAGIDGVTPLWIFVSQFCIANGGNQGKWIQWCKLPSRDGLERLRGGATFAFQEKVALNLGAMYVM